MKRRVSQTSSEDGSEGEVEGEARLLSITPATAGGGDRAKTTDGSGRVSPLRTGHSARVEGSGGYCRPRRAAIAGSWAGKLPSPLAARYGGPLDPWVGGMPGRRPTPGLRRGGDGGASGFSEEDTPTRLLSTSTSSPRPRSKPPGSGADIRPRNKLRGSGADIQDVGPATYAAA